MITLPDTDQLRTAQREAEAMTAYSGSCVIDVTHLVDPETTPKFWAWLNDITRHLHTAHGLCYIDHAPKGIAPFNPDDPGQTGAVFVHYVGQPDIVHVIRDGSGTRGWSPLHRNRMPVGRCDIGDAPTCPGRLGPFGPFTVYLSVTRGSTILVLETCVPCVELMTGVAEAGELQARIRGTIADASHKGDAR